MFLRPSWFCSFSHTADLPVQFVFIANTYFMVDFVRVFRVIHGISLATVICLRKTVESDKKGENVERINYINQKLHRRDR